LRNNGWTKILGWPGFDSGRCGFASSTDQPRLVLDAPEGQQMSGTSPYPITQFIAALMDDCGYSSSRVRQGPRIPQHGKRQSPPEFVVGSGEGYDRILKEIARAYPGHADGLEKAVAATKAIKTAEAEAAWFERCKAQQGSFTPLHPRRWRDDRAIEHLHVWGLWWAMEPYRDSADHFGLAPRESVGGGA